jgi:hypothetical protein
LSVEVELSWKADCLLECQRDLVVEFGLEIFGLASDLEIWTSLE